MTLIGRFWVTPEAKNLGFFGVMLFFVHTSCVLMGSLSRLEGAGYLRPWALLRAFAVRRFFRIYPLSILFVLVVVACGIPPFPGRPFVAPDWSTLIANLAIVQNLAARREVLWPLWTLPIEVQMYAILPFLYMSLRRGRYRSIAFWVGAVLVALVIPQHFMGRLSVIRFAPCFVAGIVAYELAQVSKRPLPAWLWPVTLALAIAAWSPFSGESVPLEARHAWPFALALGILIPQFREIRSRAVAKVAQVVAKYSYGVYLSHVVVFWIAADRMSPARLAGRILVGGIASVAVPVVVYHLVESPCIRLGARLARLSRGQSTG